ncbi:MAG: saccharopine dehydrogenase, partial [Paracoccaceae bacterium]
AGFVGAAVSLKCWAAQRRGANCPPVSTFADAQSLLADVRAGLDGVGAQRPSAIIIGSLGRVGAGALDFCAAQEVTTTNWDLAETKRGAPYPEVLAHDIFLNCILAAPGCPVFVPATAGTATRQLCVIGDIACDPASEFSPIKVNRQTTTWHAPARRVHQNPPLDVVAIDNLPSLLPLESSLDFAAQLLPSLLALDDPGGGVWARAKTLFDRHIQTLSHSAP